MASKTPTGVVVAAKVDPRFADDKQYPNQWRPITSNAAGNPVVGDPQPYARTDAKSCSGAGFYAKVTRLTKPANAIFVEYHSAFYEPQAWFGPENGNLLPSELQNRRSLSRWSNSASNSAEQLRRRRLAEKKGEKPTEKCAVVVTRQFAYTV